MGEPGSSGSVVSGYGLDDVRSPAGAKDFSSILCVQTCSGAHPASCTTGTGVLSPGVKHGRGVTLTIHPHLVPRFRMSRSYIFSPTSFSLACSGTALDFIYMCRFVTLIRYIFPASFHENPSAGSKFIVVDGRTDGNIKQRTKCKMYA
jgi:hypothetical protein